MFPITSFYHKYESTLSIIVVIIIPILCLIPFADKAFHIDAPLFIWVAQHIQTDPLNFYDFSINWYNTAQPMFMVNQNPPGVSYYIALVAFFFGWSESALHIAFILPAVAVSMGTYFLAKEWCSHPVLATLISILTPVFLVSSSTIMSDIMMLAFYVWAIVLWVYGLKYNQIWLLLLSTIFIALSALTKYFGASLIPLLFVYTWTVEGKPHKKLLILSLPMLALCGYEWITYHLYGQGLILNAGLYASGSSAELSTSMFGNLFVGITFLGGCYASVFFFTPYLWSRRIIRYTLFIITLFMLVMIIFLGISNQTESIHFSFIVQLLLFIIVGIQILALTFLDLWKNRNSSALLLSLWIIGVFVFSSLLNWTINARTLLPMLPAIGILVVRHLEINPISKWKMIFPLIPATVIAILVLIMDYDLANNNRHAASQVALNVKSLERNVWFQGNWGFQYYMEKEGLSKIDTIQSRISRDDLMVFSKSSSNIINFDNTAFLKNLTLFMPNSRWGSTMSIEGGSGFYSHQWGILPFVFGNVPDETYLFYMFY
ncbi:MAG: glycosyltransferase family 39 protein [Thiomargarita sp.]|nr:glycosyltransferase family 39 protein [Thiomargarita sp.]